jgi:endonuclease-3 related protein
LPVLPYGAVCSTFYYTGFPLPISSFLFRSSGDLERPFLSPICAKSLSAVVPSPVLPGIVLIYGIMESQNTEERLRAVFDHLLSAFGPRHWWPGDSPLEVMVGAILTQNTSWRNVEKAIANMKNRGVLDMARLAGIDEGELGEIIRPVGFYNVKSKRLKAFITDFHHRFERILEDTATINTPDLRNYLLAISGIGPETADSILLYALERPIFVVDAYTQRFLANHGLYNGHDDYHEVQRFFMENLPADTYLFNEFHALIVRLCQQHCKKRPDCTTCPLAGI